MSSNVQQEIIDYTMTITPFRIYNCTAEMCSLTHQSEQFAFKLCIQTGYHQFHSITDLSDTLKVHVKCIKYKRKITTGISHKKLQELIDIDLGCWVLSYGFTF